MHARKIGVAFVAPLVLAAGAAQAAPLGDPWYGEFSLGRDRLHLNNGGTDSVFANQGITSTTSIEQNRTAWGLKLGYRFNPYFALEGGYADFGKHGYTATATAPGADTITGDYRAHAWSLAPVGILPLDDKWSLFGKAGLAESRAELNATSSTGATAPAGASHSGMGALYGAGATYNFTQSVYGAMEWDRYAHVGDSNTTGRSDIDLLTVGVGVRF